jgi:hypothetical protein
MYSSSCIKGAHLCHSSHYVYISMYQLAASLNKLDMQYYIHLEYDHDGSVI